MSGLDKALTPLFMKLVNALVARIVTGTDPWGVLITLLKVLNIWHCHLKSLYSRYETDTVVA
jgi:hypothetical protein